jgi:L-fuconolactonase
MSRVDAHCHIWALDRGDYGWLDPSDPAMAPIAKDFGPDDLHERLKADGIGHAIVVQAAPTEAETLWLLEQAEHAPHIAGIVGWADITRADLSARLASLAANPALRGIRPMLQDLEPDWLATKPVAGWAEAMLDAGLRFDALVRPAHLATLARILQRYPDLPVVIDHAAKPALAAPSDDPRHALWREGMARLAVETGAFCKISGLLTEMDAADRPRAREILFPLMDQLLSWFGAGRLMWGSDWPVLRLAGSYADWAALSGEWLEAQSPNVQAQIKAQTARRFYGLDGGTL